MLRIARHQIILDTLHRQGPLSVSDLAAQTGASEATIRRDLADLDSEGRLRRVHGGAAAAEAASGGDSGEPDRPFHVVAADHVEEKARIGRRAAEFVRDGETVVLDIGTTCEQVAVALRGRRITVITSSLAVYGVLADDDAVDLVLLGGILRRRYRSMVGFLTEEAMRSLHADRVFLSTSGIREDGYVLDTTGIEVPVKRAMIAASDQVVLVADVHKFPGERGAAVCPPGDVGVLITNPGVSPATLATMRDAGVDIIEV